MNNPFYYDDLEALNIKIDINDRPIAMSADDHLKLVKRLAAFFKLLKKEQRDCLPKWKPAGEWLDYNNEKEFFYGTLLQDKYEEADEILRNFWRNKLGLIVKEYAKFENFINDDRDITDAFKRSIGRNFLIWKDLFHLPVERLKINRWIGNPWGCIIENELVTPKAIRFHTNALQIKGLLEESETKVVAEIGAGYGALACYMSNEIEKLKYIDFDLPETLVLAAYNLIANFPDKKIYLYGESPFTDSTIEEFEILLLPNYIIESFPSKSADVFFNSFSLSEMPAAANRAYIEEIYRISRKYFFHNNMDRRGVVNRGSERIPASEYPIDKAKFNLLSKHYDLFHGHFGDYKEFLYKVKDIQD